MADILSFGDVKKLLSDAGFLYVMQVMVRTEYASGRNQHPCILLLTDRDVFYGGLAGEKKFMRIRRHEILSVARVGKLLLTSLELRYVHGTDEKSLFLCPFTGHPRLPKIDYDRLDELEQLMVKWIPS